MKFRRRNAPLVLLLVPLATALSAASRDNMQSALSKHMQGDPTIGDAKASPIAESGKAKYDIGTKDAPVDGKDGKPHAGPFVGTEKDAKAKATNTDSALSGGKEEVADVLGPDGKKIPQVNDGVMNDPSRELPKHGTTGTEGGVSEKDKARKAQEGQTGEKLGKTPDSPKEAPPLPPSEEAKIKNGKVIKEGDHDEDDDEDGVGGFEVWLQHP
jgi:hypothetical protein